VPDSEVHYASAVLNNEDADALDKTIQELPTINEEEEILLRIRTENLLANKDEEFVTVIDTNTDAVEVMQELFNEQLILYRLLSPLMMLVLKIRSFLN